MGATTDGEKDYFLYYNIYIFTMHYIGDFTYNAILQDAELQSCREEIWPVTESASPAS